MISVHILGFVYAVSYLKEVPAKKKAAYDNPALEIETAGGTVQEREPEKNFFLEFFDPSLAKQCFRCLFKNRDFGVRIVLILLLLMHFLMNGMMQGETQNLFLYQRAKFGWDIDLSTYHNVFSIAMGEKLIGIFVNLSVSSR